jgi:hypothetical protein
MDFFQSDVGTAISWVCGVLGFIYSFIQKKQNMKLKVELRNFQSLVQNLQNSQNTKTTSDMSEDTVQQVGEKNVYTKNNSGGMHIKM